VLRLHKQRPRDADLISRVARVSAGLIAAIQLRSLASVAGHLAQLHSIRCSAVLAALLGAVMLRQLGRGLGRQLPRPQWSAGLVGAWAGCTALLFAVLIAAGGSLGSGSWSAIAVAIGLGLLLAASLPGARWVLRALARRRSSPLARRPASVVARSLSTVLIALATAPLLAGWSGRGPPSCLS
jgi:hypothetical protein